MVLTVFRSEGNSYCLAFVLLRFVSNILFSSTSLFGVPNYQDILQPNTAWSSFFMGYLTGVFYWTSTVLFFRRRYAEKSAVDFCDLARAPFSTMHHSPKPFTDLPISDQHRWSLQLTAKDTQVNVAITASHPSSSFRIIETLKDSAASANASDVIHSGQR